METWGRSVAIERVKIYWPKLPQFSHKCGDGASCQFNFLVSKKKSKKIVQAHANIGIWHTMLPWASSASCTQEEAVGQRGTRDAWGGRGCSMDPRKTRRRKKHKQTQETQTNKKRQVVCKSFRSSPGMLGRHFLQEKKYISVAFTSPDNKFDREYI